MIFSRSLFQVLGPQTTGWRPVTLSTMERAPQIELDETLTSATAWKGYRMVRPLTLQRSWLIISLSWLFGGFVLSQENGISAWAGFVSP